MSNMLLRVKPPLSGQYIGLDLAIWKFRYFIYDSFSKFMNSLGKVMQSFDVGGAHQARQWFLRHQTINTS